MYTNSASSRTNRPRKICTAPGHDREILSTRDRNKQNPHLEKVFLGGEEVHIGNKTQKKPSTQQRESMEAKTSSLFSKAGLCCSVVFLFGGLVGLFGCCCFPSFFFLMSGFCLRLEGEEEAYLILHSHGLFPCLSPYQ